MKGLVWLTSWLASALGWTALVCIAIWMVTTITFRFVEMLAVGR